MVDQAGTTMSAVVTSIKRVTDIMGEISAASIEQRAPSSTGPGADGCGVQTGRGEWRRRFGAGAVSAVEGDWETFLSYFLDSI